MLLKLKRERRSKKRNEIPTKTSPGVKKVAAKNVKKGHAEKDVKSKWAAKISCC